MADHETILQLAQAKVLADLETYGDFVAGASEDREPCAYFGPISTADLLRIANGAPINSGTLPNAEQRLAARDETLRRYLADQHLEVRHQVGLLEEEAHA